MDLDDPTTVALATSDALRAAGIRHALYGGLVLAAYGEPRETRDADFAVLDVTPEAAAAALGRAGIQNQITFALMVFGGLRISRLTLLPGERDTGLNCADLVRPLSDRFAAAVLSRTLHGPLRDRTVEVVCPEDFIVLKALSTRDRDLDDAASVIRRSGSLLDHDLIREEIEALAQETPSHDVRGRFAQIHSRSR